MSASPTQRVLSFVLLASFAIALAACASGPETIAADDEANCRYAAAVAPDDVSYQRCRAKLAAYQTHALAMNASTIQGYALLRAPAQPSDVAGRCKGEGAPRSCLDDVTGTIPTPRAKP